jgi:hypothetical protein
VIVASGHPVGNFGFQEGILFQENLLVQEPLAVILVQAGLS